MTTHVGDLGTARGPVDLTFGWFGATIRIRPTASDLALIEFLEKAGELDEGDQVGGMLLTMTFLKELIEPEQFPEFVRLARQNNQQFVDLVAVGKGIVTMVTLFPTGLPSDSSDGQQTTGPSSTDGSSSPDVSSDAARAMKILEGRPDLKLIVYQAEVARREAAQAA